MYLLRIVLSGLLCVMIAGCAQGPRKPPELRAASEAVFEEGKTYLIWHVAQPEAFVTSYTWCPEFAIITPKTCISPDGKSTDLDVFPTGRGFAHNRTTRIGLPDGTAADLMRIDNWGAFTPAMKKTGGRQALVKTGVVPIFDIQRRGLNYIGTYVSKQIEFRRGLWAPDALRAALEKSGRSDMARAMISDVPRSSAVVCNKNKSNPSCRVGKASGVYELLIQ